MYRWRRTILFALIVYFAGFATAIYAIAPVADARTNSKVATEKIHNQNENVSASEQFALAFNSHMRKCLSFAGEHAEKIGEFIKTKLAEQRTKAEQ